ncbi:MAG: purine-nucleoside phosphorylase [Lachnospiraceae bacterium]|nr:purine-nucleoside phosphorylase [Lachnospiraceae bacterium]
MTKIKEELERAYKSIEDRIPFIPEIALVLGSGLGEYAEDPEFHIEAEIPYGEIEGFPVSTVSGHDGRFVFGTVGEKKVVCMKGRVHYYEGYPVTQVVLPIRLMRRMGAQVLLLTNAAGGVNPSFKPGDFVCITDHISSFVPSPLIGPNEDDFGVRFPDMSQVYSKRLRLVLEHCAEKCKIDVKEGVYVQLSGPNYETPAEIRMVAKLGADLVGMSTVIEAMAARHMGMEICGISLVTNMACGVITGAKLSHEEVKETAAVAKERFTMLVTSFITNITIGD